LNSKTTKESYSLLKSLIALALIALCLWAAQWQYDRGVARHARNAMIESNSSRPVADLSSLLSAVDSHEWKPATTAGTFDTSSQILLRNHYSEDGVYGFELLTRFTTNDGKSFWVDCGWVKAGEDATTQPELPDIPAGEVTITGRLRLDSSLPQGSFFAIPASKSDGLVSKANAQSGSSTENFYLDLLNGSQPSLTPAVPAPLPALSDGPHMAYALQWVFFGGLVVYGRFLIRRDVLSRKEL
jgi:cytochrome oxidase assembly protein ShyY1